MTFYATISFGPQFSSPFFPRVGSQSLVMFYETEIHLCKLHKFHQLIRCKCSSFLGVFFFCVARKKIENHRRLTRAHLIQYQSTRSSTAIATICFRFSMYWRLVSIKIAMAKTLPFKRKWISELSMRLRWSRRRRVYCCVHIWCSSLVNAMQMKYAQAVHRTDLVARAIGSDHIWLQWKTAKKLIRPKNSAFFSIFLLCISVAARWLLLTRWI